MTPIFACRVAHRIVNFCQVVPFFNIILSKKKVQRVSDMAVCQPLNTSLLGLTVVFLFHSVLLTLHMFASCSHFNSSPPITSLVWTLSPYFFSPSHDCQFPKCLQHQKVKVLESFVNSYIFCFSKRSLARDFISTFVPISSTPLSFFEFCLNFLFPLSFSTGPTP